MKFIASDCFFRQSSSRYLQAPMCGYLQFAKYQLIFNINMNNQINIIITRNPSIIQLSIRFKLLYCKATFNKHSFNKQNIPMTTSSNDKNSFNIMALQKSIEQSLKKEDSKQSCLNFQYKLLLLYSSQFGIYIMPQMNTINVWHGVVFVRYGIYKEAKFKFKITFDGFPVKPPKVYFINQVYHPLIDPETGLLDLGNQLQNEWNYGTQHLIFTVIQYIRLIFHDTKKYDSKDSLNKKAGELYGSNLQEFFIKVRESVEQSKNQLYTNYPDTSLKFSPYNAKHEKIRDGLSMICQDQCLTTQEKKKKFLKLLKQ